MRFKIKTGKELFTLLHFFMVLLFLLLFVNMIISNSGKSLITIPLNIAFILFTGFRHIYLAKKEKTIWHFIFPYAEGALIVAVVLLDATNFGLAMLVLIIMDIAIDYEYKYGVVYCIIGYLIYIFKYMSMFQDLPIANKILIFLIGAIQSTIYVGIAFLARKYSYQSRELINTTAELHTRMITIEDMAVLKERNRIAGEIHNTVGHQLTTALVQIQAAQLIIEKDPEEAKRRLEIIKEQVRNGLNELRKSINAINAEEEYEDFDRAVRGLTEKVKNHTGTNLDYKLDDIKEVRLALKKTLYHVIIESITNAIRHGHCHEIKIRLAKEQGVITLTVFNNGNIPKDFKYGYGLNKMKESLKELGGKLTIKLNEEGWFGVIAETPVYHREEAIDG